MRNARAAFCHNLLAAGGYEVREVLVTSLAEVNTDEIDLCVLCSSDDAYVPALKSVQLDVPIFVAGIPESEVEQLRALGVEGFFHMRQSIVEALIDLHTRFGIRSYGPAPQEATE